jgi:hypothetical protein
MIDNNFYALILTRAQRAQIGGCSEVSEVYWTASRKAAVVEAIAAGEISLEGAQRCFRLSGEEFSSWVAAREKNGTPGLRATRFQIYRDNPRQART